MVLLDGKPLGSASFGDELLAGHNVPWHVGLGFGWCLGTGWSSVLGVFPSMFLAAMVVDPSNGLSDPMATGITTLICGIARWYPGMGAMGLWGITNSR